MKAYGRQNVLRAFVVRVSRNAKVSGRIIELRKKEHGAIAVIKGSGEHNVDPPKLPAIARPPAVGPKTCVSKRKFQTLQLLPLPGDYVDHGEKGIRPIK